ncbi:sulfatase-like hydrolase/transferase [Haloarcula sp. Atlit-120R]|uniref:sulfatase-like hydrolase/transferase n=1 Tax=Haloarcula sp. Atlit-120R TaxID=2282135 RepID=UPI000EF188E0|nr:sulfatase-like hydrolase/transferase [Haloarcula sp. Atlit-120R]RLM34462.1 sulfatase [Haloarcula sp. Atlit-120R]
MSPKQRPNVLLIVLDTARARTVLPGLESGLMPTLSRIANDGTTFTDATATAPWTLPSHAGMFTGKYASSHGVHAGNHIFDPDSAPLASRLSDAGYRTAGISGNVWISPEFGFDAGFDEFSMKWDLFWDAPELSSVISNRNTTATGDTILDVFRGQGPVDLLKGALTTGYAKFLAERNDDGARHTTSRTVKWLEQNGTADDPFFYFLNYVEPHLPYEPPEPFLDEYLPDGADPSRVSNLDQDPWQYVAGDRELTDADIELFKSLYEAELAYLDTQLGRLYDTLAEQGILDETAIILVGDHGENIGEHGLMDHQYCLYETLIHVPLIIRYPELFNDKEVSGPVELRDLYPTVTDLAGAEPPADTDVSTHSLVPRDGTVPVRDSAIAEYLVPQPSMDAIREAVESFDETATRFDRPLRAIKTTDWKFIEAPGDTELYDRDEDPTERIDIASMHPDICERLGTDLRDELGRLARGTSDETTISATKKERLEDLGYLQ